MFYSIKILTIPSLKYKTCIIYNWPYCWIMCLHSADELDFVECPIILGDGFAAGWPEGSRADCSLELIQVLVVV